MVLGICRCLEFIYPIDRPTMVFYRDLIIDSESGGQQGCPLIGACHAMVQRILLEVAGVIPLAPGTTQFGEIINPPAQLDITPMFADDSIIAGVDTEVSRVLQHWKNLIPSLGLRCSCLEAIPATGPRLGVQCQPIKDRDSHEVAQR